MSGLTGALCQNQGQLFESTHPLDHKEAAAICATCPAILACGDLARSLDANVMDHRPVGTWAGELYGADGRRHRNTPREHGTEKGYYQHKNRAERACFPCCEAMRISTRVRRGQEVVEVQTCEHHDRAGHKQWENVSGAGSTLTTSPGTSTRANPVRGSASRGY